MSEATHVECSCEVIEDALHTDFHPMAIGKKCKCRVADTKIGVHTFVDCRVWLKKKE